MARNKYPEQTVARILDAAQKLFIQKGYESTSIQDIINEAGGLTKGAIYHHFKSKEEIFVAVNDRFDDSYNEQILSITKDALLSGQEKLRSMLKISLFSSVQFLRFGAHISLLENPKLLAALIANVRDIVAPQFIFPVMLQCLEEGSVKLIDPQEAGELLLFLLNTWLNPMVFQVSQARMALRIAQLEQLLLGVGLDLFDNDIRQQLLSLNELYNQKGESN